MGKTIKSSTEDFIRRSKEIHGEDKYDYSKVDYKNSKTDIILIFEGVEYIQKPAKHFMGRCPEKNTPTRTTEQFIEEAKKVWGDKYDYSLVEYVNSFVFVKIIYEGIVFEQQPRSHLGGLVVEFRFNEEFFLKKAKELYGDRYDYSKMTYVDSLTPIIIIYDGVEYIQKPLYHLRGQPENTFRLKTNEEYINEVNKVHDFKYGYSNCEYKKAKEKVIITCDKHGDFEQNALSHLQGAGCPNCKKSKGEMKIKNFLIENNIIYEPQKKFEECKNILLLPFDFYLPDYNVLIEYDGEQHFKPSEFFGGEEAYNKTVINDNIKNEYCKINNIDLIRIAYYEYNNIEKILNHKLKIKN